MLKLVFENVSICILLKLWIILYYDSKNDVTQRNLISRSNCIEFTLKIWTRSSKKPRCRNRKFNALFPIILFQTYIPTDINQRSTNATFPAVERGEGIQWWRQQASSVISMKRRKNSPMLTNTRKCCSCTRWPQKPWSGWSR